MSSSSLYETCSLLQARWVPSSLLSINEYNIPARSSASKSGVSCIPARNEESRGYAPSIWPEIPAMGCYFSIKSVLPALFPDDPELDYHKLSDLCQNGSAAMNLFPAIAKMPPADAAYVYVIQNPMRCDFQWEKRSSYGFI